MTHKLLNLDTLLNVLDGVGGYIFTKDLEGKYTYANTLVLELFGLSLNELIGKDDHCFFESDKLDELIKNDTRVLNGEVIETEEILVLKKTGEKRYYLTVKKPLYDENQKIIGMYGISTDITEQKILEEKIREQKYFLDTILDNIDAYVYMKDKYRVFRYVNSNVAELFGLPAEEIIGKKDTDVIPKEIADTFWEMDLKVFESSKSYSQEEYFENENEGSYYWSTKFPYSLEDGTPAVLGLSTDITLLKNKDEEIKQKDKILYQQAKISTMGEMIENIAHQWRQPLSIISTTATGTKLKSEFGMLDNSELLKNLENINKHAQYLSNTIDDFRNYFLANTYVKNEINLRDSIQKTLDLLNDIYKSLNIKFVVNFNKDIYIECNENLFIQALINIFNNAKDALGQINENERYIFLNLIEEKGNYSIEIKDNAKGIKEEYLEKIFDPYFTTKHKSSGTGIGLYMTYQIITNNLQSTIKVKNETFEYNSTTYNGASFLIDIPTIEKL